MNPGETGKHSPLHSPPRNAFFFWMSVLLLVFVIVGFTPTLFLRSISDLRSLPGHLHVHGAVLTAWFVWFVVQTSMIRTGHTAIHRRLGVFGAIIGGACVFAGPLATMGSVRNLRAAGLDWGTDMSAYPIVGIEGIPMEQFAAQLVFGNFASIFTFAGLLLAAIILRRQSASHKRLMLLASISIIGPALARISRWPALGGEDGAFIPVVFFGLLLTLFVHDLVTTRRVHRATWLGSLITVVTFVCSQVIAESSLGSTVVRAMI